MNAEIFAALAQLEKERGIPQQYMIDKITQALVAAYKKDKEGYTDNVFVEVEDGDLKMYVQKEVVDDVLTPATEISLDAARKINKHAELGDLDTRNSDGCRAPRSASGPENEREPVIRRLFRSKRTRNSAYRKSKLRLRAADSRVKQTSTRTVLKPNAVRSFRDESARRRISPRRSSSRPRPYLPSTRSDNSTPRCAANSVRPP